MKIVGVTGTNGKTTCVDLICQILKEHTNCASFGTLGIRHYRDNSCFETSTKLTTLGNIELHENLIQVARNKCKFVAMEVSSHGLDQKRVAGVDFTAAVFTNLSHDHLDYHKNMENYFQAKLKLFTDYNNKLTRVIVNLDDLYGLRLIKFLIENKVNEQLQIIGFSTKSLAQQPKEPLLNKVQTITCEQVTFHNLGIQASIKTPWGTGEVNLGLMGIHNLSNLLASIAVCEIQMLFTDVLKKCCLLQPVKGRLEKVVLANNDFALYDKKPEIIIDYAHTPDGLEKALLAINKHYPNKKICCIFGCGGNRDIEKRPKMLQMADQYCNTIILTQDNSRSEDPKKIMQDILSYQISHLPGELLIEMDRKRAIYKAVANYQDHVILIAGKGHENKQIIGNQEYPFCDYTVAREACLSLISSVELKKIREG